MDGRAKPVQMTQRGWEVMDVASAIVDELEADWAAGCALLCLRIHARVLGEGCFITRGVGRRAIAQRCNADVTQM